MKKLEDLLNQDMGSTIDWLESNFHKYDLVEKSQANDQKEIFNFVKSWTDEIPELIEASRGKHLEFFDSLSDIINDFQNN